jgi:hypothetical protein
LKKRSVKVSVRKRSQPDAGPVVQSGPVCQVPAKHTPEEYRKAAAERGEQPLLPLED